LKITLKEKRYIAIGAVVVAALMIYYGFSSLLDYRADVRSKVEQKKKLLNRQRETLDHEAEYLKAMNLYSLRLQDDMNRLLNGKTPSIAASELGGIIENFANASGVEITQKNPQAEKRIDDKIIRVSIQIQASCLMDQLVPFLAAIESYQKYLTITQFQIQVFNIARFQNQSPVRKLSPTITISGYMYSPGAKSQS
jgi:hypothetical protein